MNPQRMKLNVLFKKLRYVILLDASNPFLGGHVFLLRLSSWHKLVFVAFDKDKTEREREEVSKLVKVNNEVKRKGES